MSQPRIRRHHELLRGNWAGLEAWAEINRPAIRQALADTITPAQQAQLDCCAVRIQAKRAVRFLN